MTRCPKCESPEVYRHTGWLNRHRYICRNCMSDLARKPYAFVSLQTTIFVCWLVGEWVAIETAQMNPLFVVAIGSLILAGALWLADGFQTELEVVKRLSDPLSDGTPRFARRAWFSLRRHESEPIERI